MEINELFAWSHLENNANAPPSKLKSLLGHIE
jgi:hypothetical protein